MRWSKLFAPENALLIKRAHGLVDDEELAIGVRCLVRQLAGDQERREICLVDPSCDFRITQAGLHRALADARPWPGTWGAPRKPPWPPTTCISVWRACSRA